MPERRRIRRELWLDAALAGLVVLLDLPVRIGLLESPGSVQWLNWVSLALAAVAVTIRRVRPAWSLGIVGASAALQMLSLSPPSAVNFAQLIVVFSCASGGRRTMRWWSLAIATIGALVGGAYTAALVNAGDPARDLQVGAISAGFYFLSLGLAWVLGYARWLVLRAREAQLARRIAEIEGGHARTQAESERERGRIAREMHDVLAHSLVVIATLSDAARMAIDREPDEAKRTVRVIGEVSRDAIADVRRLLAELRHEQESGPAASFDDRRELIERFEALGLPVRHRVEGEERSLTAGASLAAYRVAQEGLTNALRHGERGAEIAFLERWSDGGLLLAISNRCAAQEGQLPSGGHGLLGLRERVLLEAGRFSAGRTGEWFLLEAALPVGHAERVEPSILGGELPARESDPMRPGAEARADTTAVAHGVSAPAAEAHAAASERREENIR